MRDSFVSGLIDIANRDDRIALLTGDLGFGVVEKFADQFPDRFWNCGVAEQSMLSIAAGLAKSGMRPFVYSIANFPTFRSLEQIRNDICYHNLPVTVVSVGGGLGYGTLGYTHHGIEDIAATRSLPNICVYSPSDPIETLEVLTRIHESGIPSYLRLGKNGEAKIETNSPNQISGNVREIQAGTDLTVLACGNIVDNCRLAAAEIANHNIQVISIPQIQPMNFEFLQKTISSKKVIVVEEHVERGGLASAILESFNKNNLNIHLNHVFISEDQISQTGSQEFLRSLSGLDKPSLSKKFLEIING